MEHEFDILFTLAGGLSAALILGVLTHRLRLSPMVGYLLAGIAVGPFTPGFVAHGDVARQFSELGVRKRSPTRFNRQAPPELLASAL